MSDAPFSPFEPASVPSSFPQLKTAAPPYEKLRAVAYQQRLVMLALLANFGGNLLYLILLPYGTLAAYLGLAVALACNLFAVYAVFRLTQHLSQTAVAVLVALLMFVPCLNLAALLLVNQKATAYLKRYHIPVGFLGADPNDVPKSDA